LLTAAACSTTCCIHTVLREPQTAVHPLARPPALA
jgi:hypothetical protein